MRLCRLGAGGDRIDEAGPVADQPVDAAGDELASALAGVDGPGHDHVGELAELAAPCASRAAARGSRCRRAAARHAAPQPPQLPRAPDRMHDANALDVRGTARAAASSARRSSRRHQRPDVAASASRTSSARRRSRPLRSSMSSVSGPSAARRSARTSRGANGLASFQRSQRIGNRAERLQVAHLEPPPEEVDVGLDHAHAAAPPPLAGRRASSLTGAR